MKNLTLIVFAALLGAFVFQGCDKAHLQDLTTGSKLKVSKTQIVVGEVDSLFLTGVNSEDSIIWTISPDVHEQIRYKANEATITFSAAGTYVVTAKKAGGLPASVTITVSDGTQVVDTVAENTSTNVQTATDTTVLEPITGDVKVHLNVGYATTSRDVFTANLDAGATTTCPSGIIQYSCNIDNAQNYSVDLMNIRRNVNCTGGNPLGQYNWVGEIFPRKLVSIGTHQLKVTVNGTTYTGSFTITAQSLTINWPYTSGVLMQNDLNYIWP